MKHVTATFLFLGLSAFCAVGQNVTVLMKDGSSHKFNADYLSEISFKDVVPETPPVELKTVALDVYSQGNVTATFADESANTQLELDLYGPTDAIWMHTGTYTLAATSDPFTINPTYSKAKINGKDVKFTDATVEVSQEGRIYTFDIVLVLEDETKFHGIYVGELPTYTPWVDVTLVKAEYNENPQPAGDFYVKINSNTSAEPYYEGAIIFTAEGSAKTLPEGVYTLSETRAAGTISTTSYIDQYYPSSSLRLGEGSKITVTKDGENYTMVMELNLSDGRTGNFTYTGAISGTPQFE